MTVNSTVGRTSISSLVLKKCEDYFWFEVDWSIIQCSKEKPERPFKMNFQIRKTKKIRINQLSLSFWKPSPV